MPLRQAPILYHFGQADNPRRLVPSHDESMYFAFALHDDLHASVPGWVPVLFALFPLQGLRVSRYPGEEAFPRSQRVGNWLAPRPTSNIKLSKYKTLPLIPRGCPRFRGNGSHVASWGSTRQYEPKHLEASEFSHCDRWRREARQRSLKNRVWSIGLQKTVSCKPPH